MSILTAFQDYQDLAPESWSPTALVPSGAVKPGEVSDFLAQGHQGVNSAGWRSDREIQHQAVDFSDAILLFGCSSAWGQAVLSYTQCLGAQLAQATSRPVINFSYPASGWDFAIDMAQRARTHWLSSQPWAVVHVWTHFARWRSFDHLGWHHCYGRPRLGETPQDIYTRSWSQWQLWPLLWPDTRRINTTYFSSTSALLGIPQLKYLDRASDDLHPGARTHRALAQHLAQELAEL